MHSRVTRTVSIALVVLACLFSVIPTKQFQPEHHITLDNLTDSGTMSTLDPTMQRIVAEKLHAGMTAYRATSATALLLDNQTGKILALESYAADGQTETLEELTLPYEPGSVMKPLLVGAALDTQAIDMGFHYYDKDWESVGDTLVTNAHRYEASERSLQELITLSLNTGAVHVLEQMGGGAVNNQARATWYSYLTERYHFGEQTSTGIGADSGGLVPATSMPDAASRYAQTAFGIGVTVSPIQITAAYAAITYDGLLRSPCFYLSSCNLSHASRAVSSSVTSDIRTLLSNSLGANNSAALHEGYVVGGKSGTAPVALAGGVYKSNVEYGTYIGFFGKTEARYTLYTRMKQPVVDGYASAAAAHVWADTTQALIRLVVL
jgi:cell division protein FtsI/penicillin-binding protein 2